MEEVKKLDIYRDNQLVGKLVDGNQLQFIYSDRWINEKNTAIIPTLSTSKKEHIGETVDSFFENLLPEAGIRDLLKLKYQVSSTFGLLYVVGGDTASDLTIIAEGQQPTKPEYQRIEWSDVFASFKNQQGVIATAREKKNIRISLAGAQRKMGIVIRNEQLFLPLGNSPSTYIIKPDIERVEGVWASATNEAFVMKLAETLDLGVAKTFFQPLAKACVIERYDRIQEDQMIRKIHQLDLCQLDGKTSNIKYESEGGPSLKRCYEMLKEYGVPAKDLKRFIEWIFFNLYVGNHDSHAKNLSIYFPEKEGVRLTPFYDLLCTDIYPGLSRNFAFAIGGEARPSYLEIRHLKLMAQDLRVKENFVLEIAQKMATKIIENLELTLEGLMSSIPKGGETVMTERLLIHILKNTKKLQKRFNLI
jgi:serine/threonine-protein kinase HipA